MKSKEKICSLILLFTIHFQFAQTGPGGVGNRDGSSSLTIWLRANDLNANGNLLDNPANGTAVTNWLDYSGNANNFTQANAARRPTYVTAPFPAVNFNASLAAANLMNGSITGIYTNASVFFVTTPINDGNSHSLFDNTTASLRVEQWFNSNRVGLTRYGFGDYRTGIPSPFGINSILSYHKENGTAIV